MGEKDLAKVFEAVRWECGLCFADEIFVEPVSRDGRSAGWDEGIGRGLTLVRSGSRRVRGMLVLLVKDLR